MIDESEAGKINVYFTYKDKISKKYKNKFMWYYIMYNKLIAEKIT